MAKYFAKTTKLLLI